MCKLVQYSRGKYVADIKLNHIKNVVEQAKKTKHIKKIMLFGSAIDSRCRDESDIDLAVFGDKTKGAYIDSKEYKAFKKALFQFDWNQDYDVLYFKDGGKYYDNIMNDINNGIEIFRRG